MTRGDGWRRRPPRHDVARRPPTRELVQAVSEALFRADPVGINFETNTDEYDSEAETVVIALPKANGPRDVLVLTRQCFVEWFDAETAGPPGRYMAVAEEIWDLWQRHSIDGHSLK